MFAASFTGSTSIHNYAFSGNGLTYKTEAVPEPASMIALGAGALALVRRRRNAKK